jgi:hypothetical protein
VEGLDLEHRVEERLVAERAQRRGGHLGLGAGTGDENEHARGRG